MICGIGVDLVRIERIEKSIIKWGDRFLLKVFVPTELVYAQGKRHPSTHLSARFAAKEAFFKALGCGWTGGVRWLDVEVERNNLGKPDLILHGKAKEIADNRGVNSIFLSLSHDSEYAIAQVLLFGGHHTYLSFKKV